MNDTMTKEQIESFKEFAEVGLKRKATYAFSWSNAEAFVALCDLAIEATQGRKTWEQGRDAAANLLGTLAETTFDNEPEFSAVLKCEAAVREMQPDDLVARAARALERQCDNMAFMLNHANLPEQHYVKFKRELEQDRAVVQEIGRT